MERWLDRLDKPKTISTSESTEQLRRFRERYQNDFLGFCRLLQIQPKTGRGRIAFEPSSTQRAYCDARTSRDIICKARQIYITTIEAARDLWWFLTRLGARVVVVVQSAKDDSPLKDVSYKIRIFNDSLRRRGLILDFETESMTEWSLSAADSTFRIIAAGASDASAERKGRGGTVNRLHMTEMSMWGEFASVTFNSFNESVPKDDSEIVIESTPNGVGNEYHRLWVAAIEGRSAYAPHFFAWWNHTEYAMTSPDGFEPRTELETQLLAKGVKPEQLMWYRWKLSDKGGDVELTNQEYPSDPDTCFLVDGRGFFDGHRIVSQMRSAVTPIDTREFRETGSLAQLDPADRHPVPMLRIWHNPLPGKFYVVVVDSSEGTGGDAGSAIVFERGTGKHCATLWGQFKPRVLAKHSKWIAQQFNQAELVIERNNHGGTVLAALEAEHRYEGVWYGPDDKAGFNTTPASRPLILDTLEEAHRNGHFDTKDKYLIGEMRTFIVADTGKPQAAPGCHDDLVMPAAIGWWVICQPMRRRGGRVLALPPA